MGKGLIESLIIVQLLWRQMHNELKEMKHALKPKRIVLKWRFLHT